MDFKEQVISWAKSNEIGDLTKISAIAESLPKLKSEEYKYFPITRKLDKIFGEGIHTGSSSEPWLPFEIKKGIILHFHNGVLLEKPAHQHITYLDKSQDTNTSSNDPFYQLGIAGHTQFLYLEITKEAGTIWLVHTHDDGAPGLIQPHISIQLKTSSEAEIIEVHAGKGQQASFTNAVTDINLDANAHLTYVKWSMENNAALHVGATNINVTRDAVATCYNFSFGGNMIRNNLSINLEDEHTEANMYGLSLLSGNSQVDHHTTVDHKKANCLSNELYKGIYADKSTGVFNGKIYVRQDAQKTNAFQSNGNLLLSDQATVNTKPQLEIWADDVKCSHGATTGQLDEDQLFYLRSRGIAEKNARAILVKAFAFEILENFNNNELHELLEHYIEETLNEIA